MREIPSPFLRNPVIVNDRERKPGPKKSLCKGLFFNKVAGIVKKEVGTSVPVNLAKFSKVPFKHLRTPASISSYKVYIDSRKVFKMEDSKRKQSQNNI